MPKKKKGHTLAQHLKRHPETKKGSLRPPGEQGKGDADSRCADFEKRRDNLGRIFGENCTRCGMRSKKPTPIENLYWCDKCADYFEAR